MLKTVNLRFGADENEPGLSFEPGPMTVFVGPNNSGKSLALRELECYVESGGEDLGHIIESMEPDLPAPEVVREMVLSRQVCDPAHPAPAGFTRVVRLKSPGEFSRRRAEDPAEPLEEQLIDLGAVTRALGDLDHLADEEFALLCRDVLTLFLIRLDGQTRLALTQPRAAGKPDDHPAHHLAALWRDDVARARIREITGDAFGMFFVIDKSTDGELFRIRMSERPPLDDAEEQGDDDRAMAFHGRAHDIASLSDGVRAFTGLTAAVMSADYRIMLVDEPEAFLHPPLTRKLGKRLTQLAAERGANVMASTHSPEFLMGCVQSGHRVNVVRLTWRAGVATARHLRADRLDTMMKDPLLRSTGVLNALFHEGAIVCEADADRVFYSEINERLLAARAGGADGCLFMNAQNKQTIRRIVRPLREMGIPAVAVVDLDILKGREDFRDLLKATFVPQVFWEPWEEQRDRIQQKLRGEDWKGGGIYRASREVRAMAEQLLTSCAEYGLFIVPTGELECWLPELEVGGHGPEWLTAVFQKMGTDPGSADYQRPGSGGVWRFVQRVAQWIANPRRKGMGDEIIPLDHLLAPPEHVDEPPPEPTEAKDAAPPMPEPRADGESRPSGEPRRNGKQRRAERDDEDDEDEHPRSEHRNGGRDHHRNGGRPDRHRRDDRERENDRPRRPDREPEPQDAAPAIAGEAQAA
ncbi:AAA family ATPase [Longimicrobium sp.]|uniref:AAA family ATPase n=1 Tax=Longimicrobium sp. TaxID=2029185 RepID=UPI002CD1B33F|nr:AAA family ATPase [Longimicrobium sp.]HSU13795.1 AAA family ATPase [Longimicrobium sp.]